MIINIYSDVKYLIKNVLVHVLLGEQKLDESLIDPSSVGS